MHADVEKCCIFRAEVRSEPVREKAAALPCCLGLSGGEDFSKGARLLVGPAFPERVRERPASCQPAPAKEKPRLTSADPVPAKEEPRLTSADPVPAKEKPRPALCKPAPAKEESFAGAEAAENRRLFRDPWAFREGGFFKAFEALFRPIPLSEARVRKRASRKR